jgi:glycosyltransferase involved in cell wall biosynthesis
MDRAPIDFQLSPAALQPIRIAIVTETYPPEVNGVAMTMARMVEGLLERRHCIQLVRPRQHDHDRPATRPTFSEVLTRGVPVPRYDALKLGLPATGRLTGSWSAWRPDVVHVVTEGPLGWSAVQAARKLGLPVVSDFHTNFHTYTGHYGIGWLRHPVTAYLRSLHNKGLATLVPTHSLRRELEQLGMRNLRVVARGVDTALFSPRRRSAQLRASWAVGPHDPVALYVGRIAPEKNLPLVISAFEAMKRVNPRMRLVLVGDGPDRAGLQASHPDHVSAGMRLHEDLAAHYASADVFLFPSTSETYGNVTIEAMASGLAVVAYDYAAAAEHVRHGASGLLAPLHDADEFTRLAAGLAMDPGRVAHLGANARVATEKLDWAWIVSEFERALQDVLAASRARNPGSQSHAAQVA